MPRGKHLKIIIASDGTCAVDAINFVGPACQAATQEITDAIGGRLRHEHDKLEARLRERTGHTEREGGR